ncbi:MAG: CHAD domain-containing protein, partial [Phenylobacterium sp.]|uniref:CYTH and CHAD domain-containing protein n=1 Tax=Phenylobacterium sp. TaxID=1871053 RepID=UPI002732F098
MPAGSDDGRLETELKFELAPDAVRTLRGPGGIGAGQAKRLHSVYFDTPRHDLKNRGVTLRVRQADGAFIQTVKQRQGVGALGRNEWETPVVGETPEPLAFGATPAAAVLNGDASQLAPVFATTVERSVHLWRDGETVVEVSLDEGEITAGSQSEPIRELELELKAGDPAALFVLARELARHTPMRLSFESKGERGYRLAGHDGVAALKAERSALSPEASAAEAFRGVARSALTQITGNAQLLRRVRTPETLHQTRVGLRRLRAALTIFKAGLPANSLMGVKAEAKWLAGELNAARDLDVFIQDTYRPAERRALDDPGVVALGARLLHLQAEAYERALAALDSSRFSNLLLSATTWVEVGDWTNATAPEVTPLGDTSAAELGAAVLERLRSKVRKAGRRLSDLDPASRHALRIRAKKLRYGAEFFAGAFEGEGKRRRRFLETLKRLQDALGELNDIAVAREMAPRITEGRGADLGFT